MHAGAGFAHTCGPPEEAEARNIRERHMSQKARRTWAPGAICMAVVAAGAASYAVCQVGLAPAGAQEAGAPAGSGQPPAMGPDEYARLAELRLTDEALAMGAPGA